uniref:exo-alpha-sialidase n=1 Tax=Amphiprion percula TaxID=161767 RepID=A0A3P8U5X8_AMPPE
MGNVTSRNVQPQQQSVFKSDGWVYRIPALFYERESKTLLAFAEQRTTVDDSQSKMLVMKRGKLKEETPTVKTIEWSELQPVEEAQIDGYRPMNPCPLYDKTSKTLFLFFICVEGTVSEQWQIKHSTNKARLCYITSIDLGKTWSKLTDLTDKLPEIKTWATFAVGPGHGLQTEQGRLIVPLYAYTSDMNSCCRLSKSIAPFALSLYSDDSGKNWQFGQMFQAKSIECEMAEFFDESGNSIIYCNARTEGGFREEHVSESNGHEFCKLSGAQKLVETGFGCQGSLVSFPAQNEDVKNDQSQKANKWLLFTHPSHQCRRVSLGVYLNKTPRDPKSWSEPWIINSGPSGYSDLVYIGEGWFACLVESGKEKETEQIASVVFSYNELKQVIGE